MTCAVCKKDGLHAKDDGMHVCWCRIDLCLTCILDHVKICEWAKAMKIKPEKKKKANPLPKIGKQTEYMKKRYRKAS